MMDAQQRQVVLDLIEHRRHRAGAEQHQPFAFGRSGIAIAEFGSQGLAHRDQVVAGVKPLGNRADILAQRLAVTQMGRAGEHLHLPAGVVDVVFADHLVSGKFEQAGQRVAHHRAAAVAHMHRSGRIGRDIFDVDH